MKLYQKRTNIQSDLFNQIKIIRSVKRFRTINLKIKNGVIELYCPYLTTKKTIHSIINKKSNWIKRKLLEMDLLEKKKKEFEELKFIMFKGKKISLNFQEGKENKVILSNNNLEVITKIISHKKKKIIIFNWLKREASKYLLFRLNYFSKKHLIKFKSLEVKNFKARWGSCNTNLDIQLNWKLIMLPSRIIDYVIIHELCHIKVPNHSKSFWSHVSSMDPLYKEKSEWLKNNGSLIIDF